MLCSQPKCFRKHKVGSYRQACYAIGHQHTCTDEHNYRDTRADEQTLSGAHRLPPRFFLTPSSGRGRAFCCLGGAGSCSLASFSSISSRSSVHTCNMSNGNSGHTPKDYKMLQAPKKEREKERERERERERAVVLIHSSQCAYKHAYTMLAISGAENYFLTQPIKVLEPGYQSVFYASEGKSCIGSKLHKIKLCLLPCPGYGYTERCTSAQSAPRFY